MILIKLEKTDSPDILKAHFKSFWGRVRTTCISRHKRNGSDVYFWEYGHNGGSASSYSATLDAFFYSDMKTLDITK